uniref:Retrovirus-related Pol polyprotein from transposon TNT 1-94 n=1 Tax=Tanacetum cinerariifolium TaxID=118510 RepID=A0A699H2G7_TANCI|nr:retrovirus-related Pol polyprotein from transposon TNT 1-94 [Tanacetum cinerariifolium]
MNGILRQFSIARTSQQNRVAQRRNRILIEAARTMLADSKLSTTFWAEAINTACYVQNRVLVVKPHNKTPYELFHGRTPALSLMKLFGCPVTILNTLDHLGKFNGKVDEGFFVGYSMKSKAFRVFNSRKRITKENLHIRFSEYTPNIVGSGPDWLFDIDALTKTMNYEPIATQSNGFAGTKACDNADPKSSQDDRFQTISDSEKKVDEDPRKESECRDQEQDDNVNSTNNVNATSTNRVNVVSKNTSNELPFDPDMLALEDISTFNLSSDHEDDDEEADMNNMDTTIQSFYNSNYKEVWTLVDLPNGKRAIGTKWVFRNKKDERDIVIRNKARLVAQGHTQEEGIDYDEVFAPVAIIKAIRLFLAYASFKDFVVYQMDVKSAFLYGKIEEEVYVCQPPGFEDPDFPDKVYKVAKALYGLYQAPRAWYETLSTYLLDNGFHRGKIDKTLFIRRHKGLQVKQKQDGIFISQDKYVDEILKKYRFSKVKNASTPIETQKPLLKDKDGKEVDVHMYRSMIGSLMYLTSSRPDIMFVVCACARYQVNPKVSHFHAMKRIFKYLKGHLKLGLWYPKDLPFDLVAYTDSDYAGASLNRKSTTGGCQFLGCRLISWQCKKQTMVANSITKAEYFWATVKAKTVNGEVQLQALVDGKKVIITESTVKRDLQLEDVEGVDCLPNVAIFEQLTLMGKVTEVPQPSDPTEHVVDEAVNEEMNDSLAIPNHSISQGTDSGGGPRCQETMRDTIAQTRSEKVFKFSNDSLLVRVNTPRSDEDSLKLKELMELCTNLQKRVLDLENTKTTQALEIDRLKRRVKKLEKKQRSRTHKLKRLYKGRISAIDADEEITLVNDQDDEKMFDADKDLHGEEVFLAQQDENVVEKEVDVAQVQVSTAATTATISIDEDTLAQALAELRHIKPKAKAKRIVFHEPEESTTTTTTTTIPKLKSQDKEGQQELNDKEKATLFTQLLEKMRKFFAVKRAEEKRNKLPTQAHQIKIMCTFLKNMEGKKLTDLKNKSFDSIQKMFDRAFKRVNIFVDCRTELVEESSKKAKAEMTKGSSKKDGEELEQENAKK